jgi:hypothetical protein
MSDHDHPCRHTRVVKKLSPDQHGALKLARRYGDALVCVRYRQDLLGLHWYTTVELVVDEAPVLSARTDATIVSVQIERGERALSSLVRSRGATCDPITGLWHMPRRLAHALGLLQRLPPK